jgi:hypothetical protein
MSSIIFIPILNSLNFIGNHKKLGKDDRNWAKDMVVQDK